MKLVVARDHQQYVNWAMSQTGYLDAAKRFRYISSEDHLQGYDWDVEIIKLDGWQEGKSDCFIDLVTEFDCRSAQNREKTRLLRSYLALVYRDFLLYNCHYSGFDFEFSCKDCRTPYRVHINIKEIGPVFKCLKSLDIPEEILESVVGNG